MHSGNDITLTLYDEAATLACGARLASILVPGLNIYLHGDLGAGKTTFVRGVLHGLGHIGKVKSPTYTLVEPYVIEFNNINCNVVSRYNLYHFDLYRFIDEEEWEAAGFREYFNAQSVCMIEWPEKAVHVLPAPDIHIHLSLFNAGRKIQFSAGSPLGKACLETF
jgi:tRNA threonylcarbamoyladenosine biosynthesis protein TsaE